MLNWGDNTVQKKSVLKSKIFYKNEVRKTYYNTRSYYKNFL